MHGLEGRCYVVLASLSEGDAQLAFYVDAENALTRCNKIIQSMVEVGTARGYNTTLMDDMFQLLESLKSKKNAE